MTPKELNKAKKYSKAILEDAKDFFNFPDFDDCLEATDIEEDKEHGGFYIKAYGTLDWARGSGIVRKCLREWLEAQMKECDDSFIEYKDLKAYEDIYTDDELQSEFYEYQDEWLAESDCGYWYTVYAIPYECERGRTHILIASWIDRNIDMYPDPLPHKLYLYAKGLMSSKELNAYDGAMSKIYHNTISLQNLDEKEVDIDILASTLVNKLEDM